MWKTRNLRTWRAVLIASGLFLICLPAQLIAETVSSAGSVDRATGSDEPFELSVAAMVSTGALQEKWFGVERQIGDERQVLRICEENPASCPSRPALEFLAIIDSARALKGRAQLGEINRAINLAITLTSDLALYGAEDVWSPPLATLAMGAGDCEDYAIAKFVALREVGISPDDLRIVIMRDTLRGEDHAVTAARLDGHWLMLDNRHMAMVEDVDVRNYRPLFVIDDNTVRLYSDAPSMSGGIASRRSNSAFNGPKRFDFLEARALPQH